jgi:predicted alternative tryptophan synthase beta-subunit
MPDRLKVDLPLEELPDRWYNILVAGAAFVASGSGQWEEVGAP